MRKIMVWNSKGGVGKTTTVINLGCALAREGKKVLMVDLGFQNNIAEWLNIKTNKKSIYDYTTANFDVSGFNDKNQNITENEFLIEISPGVYLIKLISNTEEVADFIEHSRILGDIIPYLDMIISKYDFDFVIMDSAPEVTETHKQILNYVDEIFIPVSMEYSSLHGTLQVMELTQNLLGDIDKITRIIPTFIDFRNRRTTEITRVLREYFGDKVGTKIRVCNKLSVAVGHHKDIFSFAEKSTGAKDYKLLARRVIEDEVRNNAR